MRVRTSVICALVAALGWSHPALAEVVPLAALEQRALERHALLRAGAARTRAAGADVTQAESAYRPRMGLNADLNAAPGRTLLEIPEFTVNEEGVVSAKRGGTYRVQGTRPFGQTDAFVPQIRTGVDLSIGANLYDFGRTRAAVAASRAKLRAAKVDEDVTRGEIVAGVRGAYLGWLSAHQLLQLSERSGEDATRRSERARALVEEGARPRSELVPVEAERLLSELERERALGEVEGARLLLEQSVGEPLGAAAEPDPGVLMLQLEPQDGGESDAGLKLLEAQRQSLQAAAQLQRRSNAPVLSTTFSVGIHAQAQAKELGDWTAFPTYLAGLALAVPLWDGGGSRAGAEAADARGDEVRIRLEHAELGRAQELARVRLEVAHAEQRARTAEQLLAVTKQRVADVEAGYELGAMQSEQVQQARALQRRAETELVLARVARAEAVLRVKP